MVLTGWWHISFRERPEKLDQHTGILSVFAEQKNHRVDRAKTYIKSRLQRCLSAPHEGDLSDHCAPYDELPAAASL